MNRNNIHKEYLPTDKENTFLKIHVYYALGGMNYFTGKEERRGYYLLVTPVERSGMIETYSAFSGYKHFISSATRFNKKTATNIALQFGVGTHLINEYQWLIDKVLAENSLSLIEETLSI